MNQQEKELEMLVNEVQSERVHIPPLFELYVTIFSIAVAIMLFAYPDMISSYEGRLYNNMLIIMSQSWWAISFFAASMFKAIGLLINCNWMRKFGLVASAVLYLLLTICYAIDFPTIGSITFGLMAVFSMVSIAFVKHTSIRISRRD